MDKLIISYSKLKTIVDCEQAFYWSYKRKLEKKQYKTEYIMGNMHQLAVYLLQLKVKDPERLLLAAFDKEVSKLRADFSVSLQDEQEFVEMRVMLKGMLRGYAKRYNEDLRIETHIANELDSIYYLEDGIYVRIKMDNILAYKDKWYCHEIKAWKSLNPKIVENVKKNMQIAMYYHIHNAQFKKKRSEWPTIKVNGKIEVAKPFRGVVFDAIQKPGISKKKGETYRGYLKRLDTYYDGPDASNKFYREEIQPEISWEHIKHTIIEYGKRMKNILQGSIPIRSFSMCSWCDYNSLCFEGETKQILAGYKKK